MTGYSRRLLAVLATTVLGLAAAVGTASAHGTVDQQLTTGFAGAVGFNSVGGVAQGFTPTAATVGAVDIFVTGNGSNSPLTLDVTIRDGQFDGPVLVAGTAMVPANIPASPPTEVHVDFANPAALTVGQQYYLHVAPDGGFLGWAFTNEDAYPGGGFSQGGVSIPVDVLFRTYAKAAGAPRITDSPPPGAVDTPYTFTVPVDGDPATVTITGTLPAGLTATGDTISGTPTQVGNFPLTVTATNAAGTATTTPTLSVDGPATSAPTIEGTPPGGTVGVDYPAFGFTVEGTPAPTVSVTAGTLPPGLSLAGDGTLSGTPTAAGTFTFTATATNSEGSDSTEATVTVVKGKAASISGGFAAGKLGVAYSDSITLRGTPTPTAAVTAGALPDGLDLAPDGTLTGTPTTVGKYTFTVTATNGVGKPAVRKFTVKVSTAKPSVSGRPPAGKVGVAYGPFAFTLKGAPPPTILFFVGDLPDGLDLAPDGTVTGTPTAAGKYTFTLTVVNSAGQSAKKFTITVNP